MRQVYNKLVRDRIPEIIRESGRDCAIEIMPEEEYRQALLEKLVEEAQEACQAQPETLATEIADLYEVIDAVIKAFDLDRECLRRNQEIRHKQRGGFSKRIRLLWIEQVCRDRNSIVGEPPGSSQQD
jgi:predicted house-cleaning noncanonical NTP pyrophosphatase (MazG superfamily)